MEREVKLFLGAILIILAAMFANSFLTNSNDSQLTGKVTALPDIFPNILIFVDSSNKLISSINENSNIIIKFTIKNGISSYYGAVANIQNSKNTLSVERDGIKIFESDSFKSARNSIGTGVEVVVQAPFTVTQAGKYCSKLIVDSNNQVQESNEGNNVKISPNCLTVTCTNPNWQCTSWSPAICPVSGTQTRTCTDTHNCGVNTGKPAESKSCTYVDPVNNTINTTTTPTNLIVDMYGTTPQSSGQIGVNSCNSGSSSTITCDLNVNLVAGNNYHLRGFVSSGGWKVDSLNLIEISSGNVVSTSSCGTPFCQYTTSSPVPNSGSYRLSAHAFRL